MLVHLCSVDECVDVSWSLYLGPLVNGVCVCVCALLLYGGPLVKGGLSAS